LLNSIFDFIMVSVGFAPAVGAEILVRSGGSLAEAGYEVRVESPFSLRFQVDKRSAFSLGSSCCIA
jgi:hypothetical protein